ncbi:hypothetical protein FSP39_005823 [Pinctada imbricata]|uniref:Integrase catalytic domain-containing protein n=1 Tax=Pinctada imbricata TaxID=66713 RepID=A0AA88XTW7_PINIB|nr:hypothetical protein FSP39_005823 [Pinctada imbricata]
MSDVDNYLQSIYYEPSNPAAFSSEEKLYRAVKNRGISRAKVKKWLQTQESYSIHKQSRTKINRRSVIATYKNHQWDIDTAVLDSYKKQNDGFAYFLLAIDIFSRFVWTAPLKTKTGIEVAQALEKIFKTAGANPHYIRTDKGTEYLNSRVKKILTRKHVKHFVSQNSLKASYAERAIKTIKKKLFRLMTYKHSHQWIDYLEDVTQSYNNTYHHGIRKAPIAVNKDDRYQLWILQRANVNKKVPQYKFKIGDPVRISHLRNIFRREYDDRWTREIFFITSKFIKDNICFYTLKDYSNEEIIGNFYQSELQKAVIDDNATYTVEKVLRKRKRNNKEEVLVKWLGWDKKFNSWIPLSELKDVQR